MNLQDYRKADCNLFRVPPIDFTSIEKEVENSLVNAWKNSNGVGSAINQLTSNDRIIKALANQVSENLNFQRKVITDKINSEKEKTLTTYDAERKLKVDSIEKKTNDELLGIKDNLYKTEEKLKEETKAYDASQASLNEMRGRINEKLAKIGGQKGLEVLIKLNDNLLDIPKPEKKEKVSKVYEKKDNLENKTEYMTKAYQEKATEKKGFLKKVWRVLNYKIW